MNRILLRQLLSVAISGVIVMSFGWALAPAAYASKCFGTDVGGKTIGWIEFDNLRVPLKQFSYPAGGKLDPPASAAVVGVSSRHQPLLAQTGTTVLAWHVRYGQGCSGALNPLLKKSIGSKFEIVAADGTRQAYELVERKSVTRGKYQPEWFRTNGPAQVSLFTCSNLRNGEFENTSVFLAEPVQQDT